MTALPLVPWSLTPSRRLAILQAGGAVERPPAAPDDHAAATTSIATAARAVLCGSCFICARLPWADGRRSSRRPSTGRSVA